MPSRRCSGESTRNSPPNDQNACPPRAGLGLLVEQDHPPAGVGQLGGGDQAGQPGPDDDDIGAAVAVLTVATLAGHVPPRRPPGSDAPGPRPAPLAHAGARSARTRATSGPTSSRTAGPRSAAPPPSAPSRNTRHEQAASGQQRGQRPASAQPPRAGPGSTRTDPVTAASGQQQRDDRGTGRRVRSGCQSSAAEGEHLGGQQARRRRRRTARRKGADPDRPRAAAWRAEPAGASAAPARGCATGTTAWRRALGPARWRVGQTAGVARRRTTAATRRAGGRRDRRRRPARRACRAGRRGRRRRPGSRRPARRWRAGARWSASCGRSVSVSSARVSRCSVAGSTALVASSSTSRSGSAT